MTRKATVDDFLAQRTLALVGASRSKGKFGNTILKELRGKGYQVYPVHPEAEAIDDVPCVRNLSSLPEPVGGVVIVVPPAQTERVVREAAAAGIRRVWMQQGAESEAAVRICRENDISEVHGECILMFAEPAMWVHRTHRWFRKVSGKLPQ